MCAAMDRVKLHPLTRKGYRIIDKHGDVWNVTQIEEKVLWSNISGPWFFIEPSTGDGDWRASRWVHSTIDDNFEVIEYAKDIDSEESEYDEGTTP